jgi:hypothetical protein
MSSAEVEQLLAKVADWGATEDWTDWDDAISAV